MTTCKAISLWQPWASLVVAGLKRIETRSWPLPAGRYLIHAAKKTDGALRAVSDATPAIAQGMLHMGYPRYQCSTDPQRWHGGDNTGSGTPGPHLPLGCFLGFVTVLESVRVSVQPMRHLYATNDGRMSLWYDVPPPPDEAEYHLGDHTPGRFDVLLADPVPLRFPKPGKGGRAVWTVDLGEFSGLIPKAMPPVRVYKDYRREVSRRG